MAMVAHHRAALVGWQVQSPIDRKMMRAGRALLWPGIAVVAANMAAGRAAQERCLRTAAALGTCDLRLNDVL
jgi:hypothetical protein